MADIFEENHKYLPAVLRIQALTPSDAEIAVLPLFSLFSCGGATHIILMNRDKISSIQEARNATQKIIQKHGLNIEVEVTQSDLKKTAAQYHKDKELRLSKHLIKKHPSWVERIIKGHLGVAVIHQRGLNVSKLRGETWKEIVRNIGLENPEEKMELQLCEYRYIVHCSNPDCENRFGRHRKSKLVKNPEDYICRDCEEPLELAENSGGSQ